MKRVMIALVLCSIASMASAQVAVEFKNDGGVVFDAGTTTWVDNALVQLIWSTSTNAQADVTGTDFLGNGEHLLKELTTTLGYGGTWSDILTVTEYYTDANVGGADIYSGYLFVRMFNAAATDIGDYYLQQYYQVPTLTQYSASNPSTTIYKTNGEIGGLAFDDSEFGHQMVPEPAVISLIGIFGGGLLVAKRLFARS